MLAFVHEHMEFFRYALSLAGAGLTVAIWLWGRKEGRLAQWGLAVLVFLLVVFSVVFYGNRNYYTKSYFNAYEFYHYYLGAKYHDELGYRHLYDVTVVAMEELGEKQLPRTYRDLYTDNFVPARVALAKKEELKGRFSEERWTAWLSDIAYLRTWFKGEKVFGGMVRDKGFNATPVWVMVARPLTNIFTPRGSPDILWLSFLDVYFALLAFFLLERAFGLRVASMVFVLMLTHYVTSKWPLKAAFMRLDWVMALLCGVATMKMKRFGWAGFFVAYATCMRVFPVLFAVGLGAKFLLELALKREVNRDLLRFFVGATVTGVVLVGASMVYTGGLGSWTEFIGKIRDHSGSISAWRIGFQYVFLTSYDANGLWNMPFKMVLEEYGRVMRVLQGVVLVVFAGAAYRVKPYEALAMGIIPVFMLTASTYYYYIMLGVPALFFAARLERGPYAFGLVLLFVSGALGHHGYLLWGRTWPLFFMLSCCVAVIGVYMMVLAGFRREAPAGNNAPDSTEQDGLSPTS